MTRPHHGDTRSRWTLIGAAGLLFVAISAAAVLSIVASRRALSSLESVLLQLLSLSASVGASYYFAKISVSAAASDVLKPHARSAFRRVLSLYVGLSRLAKLVDRGMDIDGPANKDAFTPYDTLKAVLVEQISTANAALDDWRDIVPDEVEEVIARAARGEPMLSGQVK